MKLSDLLSKNVDFRTFDPTKIDRQKLSEKLEETKKRLDETIEIKNGIIKNCDLLSYSYSSNNALLFSFCQDDNTTSIVISTQDIANVQSSGMKNADQWRIFFEPIEKRFQEKINLLQNIIEAN